MIYFIKSFINNIIFKYFFISLSFLILTLGLVVGFFYLRKNKTSQVCFDDVCYEVEVVDDFEGRKQGLMNRASMPKDQGMLFVFDEQGLHSFWMKNMKIALDIIWLNDDKTIVDIRSNVMPCEEDSCSSYAPRAEAKYVLELNAGQVAEKHLFIGDTAEFKQNIK